MPKMPNTRARPVLTPLAAMKLNPVYVDRSDGQYRIRTLKPNEVTEEIAGWLTDPAVMEGLNAPQRSMGLDAFRSYVASFDNLKRCLLVIRRVEDSAPLGLLVVEADLRHKLGSIHMIIGDASNRGKGMAMATCLILARHLFSDRKFEKLTFQPLARNVAAISVCEAAGIRLEGKLLSHRIDGRTGERLDQFLYAITRQEFEERFPAHTV